MEWPWQKQTSDKSIQRGWTEITTIITACSISKCDAIQLYVVVPISYRTSMCEMRTSAWITLCYTSVLKDIHFLIFILPGGIWSRLNLGQKCLMDHWLTYHLHQLYISVSISHFRVMTHVKWTRKYVDYVSTGKWTWKCSLGVGPAWTVCNFPCRFRDFTVMIVICRRER